MPMKILHIYPKSDKMITSYVDILADGLRHSAEVKAVDSLSTFRSELKTWRPDIIHCHGCWLVYLVRACLMAQRRNVRVVISPHGQLEPWALKEKSPQEKLQQVLSAQRRATRQAYALIVFGKMERTYIEKLAWNNRVEIVSNCIITNSITPKEMCARVFAVYQKIIDSNTQEHLTDADRQLLAFIIKASITGDKRWIDEDALKSLIQEGTTDWRRLLLYAEHENIRNYVDYGIDILGLKTNDIDTASIPAYFPDGYVPPRNLRDLVGEYKGKQTEYLIRMIRQIQKQPLLLHLIELHRELRRDTVDDAQLAEALEEKGLQKYAARLMQVLTEQTLLDEGYLPIPPLDDRGTRQIRNLIANHLKI